MTYSSEQQAIDKIGQMLAEKRAKRQQAKPTRDLKEASDILYHYLNQAIPNLDDDAYAELHTALNNIVDCAVDEVLHIIKQKQI